MIINYLNIFKFIFFLINIVKWPFNDYKNPTKFGLNNVHNFYLDTEANVKIGIWYLV